MSTEAKKWTQEELEVFLQEQEWEDDWEDDWEGSLPGEDEEWEERLQEQEERRELWESHWKSRIKEYELDGFKLGKGAMLLEELEAWLPRKRKEWREIRDQQPNEEDEFLEELNEKIKDVEASIDRLERKGRENWSIDDHYERDGYRERLDELLRDRYNLYSADLERDEWEMNEWLADEWSCYLETKEHMLRKTRSKDLVKAIMSFC